MTKTNRFIRRCLLPMASCATLASPAHAVDIDALHATTRSAAFFRALGEMCIDGQARISRQPDYDEWRNAILQQSPLVTDSRLQEWIDSGIQQAEQRYRGRKPPKTVCAFIKEHKAVDMAEATRKRNGAPAAGVLYQCTLDGHPLFSDYRYRSIPCNAFPLPGQAPPGWKSGR